MNFPGKTSRKICQFEFGKKNQWKMGRRKSKSTKKDLNDSFDEEVAKKIYGKQEYEAPLEQGLSTILEADKELDGNVQNGRPARSSKAELLPQPRKLTSQPFYIQDQDKDVLRKKQVAKLFKGRRKDKPKWKGLSAKKEEALFKIIAEKTDTSEDESEPEEEMQPASLIPYIVTDDKENSESRLSGGIENIDSSSQKPYFVADDNDKDNLESRLSDRIENIEGSSRKLQEEMHQNIKDADAFFGPLGFSDEEDEEVGEESSFKQWRLASDDKENVTKNKDRRKSKITKVRRSSRFFKGSSNTTNSVLSDETNLGSIYQSVEISEKTVGRRSMLTVVPLPDSMDET